MSNTLCVSLGNSYHVENPSPEEIDWAIGELRPIKGNHVILGVNPRIENCEFLQTLIEYENDPDGFFTDDELVFLVQVQHKFVQSKVLEKGGFKQYSFHTSDMDEVKRMFRMFALGVVPSVAGWKDITNELNALIDKRDGLA